MSKFVSIESDGAVAIVRMAREEKRNSFDVALIDEVHEAALALRKMRDVRVVVLTGTEKCFSAGADLKDPLQFDPSTSLPDKHYAALLGSEMARAWGAIPQVAVAAVERYAIGGGLGLAIACDFRVMGKSAFLWVPEVEIGANYGWNTVPKLMSLVGLAKTRRMVLLAERIGAQDALEWGLVDEVVEDGETLSRARALADRLVKQPAMALALSKRAINVVANAVTEIASHADMEQVLLSNLDYAREKAESEGRRERG